MTSPVTPAVRDTPTDGQPRRVIRIVAPPARVKFPATIEDTQPGDTVEFVDPPVYAVDPHTWKPTAALKQFRLGRTSTRDTAKS